MIRRASIGFLATWLAMVGAAHAAPTIKLKNATSGATLGSAITLTGVLVGADPGTQATSLLAPTIRYEVDHSSKTPSGTTKVYLRALGDLTSSGGTIPLANLLWNGQGIDTQGSKWSATNGTTSPALQPLSLTSTTFGTSPAKKRLFFYDQQYQYSTSWLHPWGTYSVSLRYGYKEGSSALVEQPLSLSFAVPARVAVSAPIQAFTLTAAPADPARTTGQVALTARSNGLSSEQTKLTITASPLSDGVHTMPTSALACSINGGAYAALGTTGVTFDAHSGASAGSSRNVSYQVSHGWGVLPGTYTTTLSYTAALSSGAAPQVVVSPTTLSFTMQPHLTLAVNTGTVALTADPLQPDVGNQAPAAAVISVQSNYAQATLAVTAAIPASGTDTMPVGRLAYRLNALTPPVAGSTAQATLTNLKGQGVWEAFTGLSTDVATLTGATDGAVFTYDYRVQPNWDLPPGTYTTTVTYTVTAL